MSNYIGLSLMAKRQEDADEVNAREIENRMFNNQ